MRAATLARTQGVANVLGGVWPLLHLPSFEQVFGRKTDKWLVRTVAGLLVANGAAQLRSASTVDGLEAARWIGVGTAVTLAAIDVTYAPLGRISRMYLADAVVELGWLIGWTRARP